MVRIIRWFIEQFKAAERRQRDARRKVFLEMPLPELRKWLIAHSPAPARRPIGIQKPDVSAARPRVTNASMIPLNANELAECGLTKDPTISVRAPRKRRRKKVTWR